MHSNRISLSFAFLLAALVATPIAHAVAVCPAGNALSTPTTDFTIDNVNHVVTHLKTGLMWKQCVEGQSGANCATGASAQINWGAALSAAATPFAGYSDWRLPNEKELKSIVETGCYSPTINDTAFPNTPNVDFWTSTSYTGYAFTVNFNWGTSNVGFKTSANYVRLVRGGQPMDTYPNLALASQAISFGAAPTLAVGGTGTVSATGGASGNAVTFTSTTTGVCTVSGSTVTGVTAGTCTIAADQAGNASYNAAPQATQSFSVTKAGQTITFGTAPAVVVGGTGTVSASGGASGSAVTFTSTTTGVCTVSGSTVTGVSTGTCTIAADQAGNGNYNAAAQVTQSFSVGSAGLASQTISFGVAPTLAVGGTGTVSATGGASGNAVTFTSTTTGVCTVSGSTVTGVTAGTCTIAADQAGNGSYNAAPQATQSFSVAKAGQSISFGAAPTLVVGGTGTVSATGGVSGNAVTFSSSTTGVCTISGSTVTGVTAGTCTIAADQAGNGNYNAATQATQSFSVAKAGQTISFGAAPAVVVGGTGTVSASGGASGNAVTFSSSTPGVCTISGSTVTGVAAGTCTIAANQASNGNYNAAPQATQSFSVSNASGITQTISLGALPAQIGVGGTATLSASGGASGNAITFSSSTPGVCTVSGNTVTGVAAGTCTIAANQAGNASYSAAAPVTRSFAVGALGAAVASVPTLSEWAMLLLAGLLGLVGMGAMRRPGGGAAVPPMPR